MHKPKSKAKYRVTVYLRPVKAATIPESWSMPHLEADINHFKGNAAFASIDFVSGYWQPPVDKKSWAKLGVITPSGVLAATRTLPGMKNAATNFQWCIEPCFAELRNRFKAWIDDFCIHGPDENYVLDSLDKLFSICASKNLYVSAKKSV